MDISRVHIIFQRHAEAISNVRLSDPDGTPLAPRELHDLVNELVVCSGVKKTLRASLGLPDGLTRHGIDEAEAFVGTLTECGHRKLDTVYFLASSPLTRAVQTLQITQKAFGLVGNLHFSEAQADVESKAAYIHVHSGIKESSLYPQDMPPALKHQGDRRFAFYISIAGGDEMGTVVGEENVDFTNVIWAEGLVAERQWETLDARMVAQRTAPSLEQVEEGARKFRVWLRNWAKRALQEHNASGSHGIPKIVVSLHGGIINFVTQRWSCVFARDDSGDWKWEHSTTLRNLDVSVYTFESLEDEDAKVRELDYNALYAEIFGKRYRYIAGEYAGHGFGQSYQKAEHWKFIQRSAHSASALSTDVHEALLFWKGCDDFQAGSIGLQFRRTYSTVPSNMESC